MGSPPVTSGAPALLYKPPPPVRPPYFRPLPINPPLPTSHDLAFVMSVTPREGLTLGDTFTVTLRITNREARRVTGIAAAVNIGDGALVDVINAQGGALDQICGGAGANPCRHYGVEWRGMSIAARGVVARSVTVKVLDFACLGGGDFQHLVYGTLVGPVLHGYNGGSYRVWYENGPEDLLRATGDRSVLDRARGARGQCVSESVA